MHDNLPRITGNSEHTLRLGNEFYNSTLLKKICPQNFYFLNRRTSTNTASSSKLSFSHIISSTLSLIHNIFTIGITLIPKLSLSGLEFQLVVPETTSLLLARLVGFLEHEKDPISTSLA